jgi:anthranilate/para-aminobenzoate synthase component II
MAQQQPHALFIDHDDSFTHNVVRWLEPAFDVTVVHHAELPSAVASPTPAPLDWSQKSPNLIVVSPGPRSPQDYPRTLSYLKTLPASQPVLGICLGLQMMALLEGAEVVPYAPPRHGVGTPLSCPSIIELQGLIVGRYHSLCCQSLPPSFEELAQSEGLPMWLRHRDKKWMGFQFHPESFLTERPDR